ncbi:hypothetical protein chiPu_0020794, partial [Chiloscyllium punctatum]|nr:hypothetical protein [Chiloscyllium punctatum]
CARWLLSLLFQVIINMADTDLFMECEEEELEPWQLIEDDVVDDTGGGMLLSATNNVTTGTKSGITPVSVGDLPNNEVEKKTMLAVVSPNSNAGGPPVMNSSGQPLIVAQNPPSLSSQMAVPPMYPSTAMQVLQDAKTGATSSVSGQPIFITTQGFTMKDLRSVQNPVGIVLNVQGGQGAVPYQTKPLTLVPGTWNNEPGGSVTGRARIDENRQKSQKGAGDVNLQSGWAEWPQPPASSFVNFLQNTNLIRLKATESASAEIRPKPEEVVKSSILPPVQITTITTTAAAAASQLIHKNSLNHTTPFKLPESNMNNGVPIPMDCPKCNIHFNIMESLKVHMASPLNGCRFMNHMKHHLELEQQNEDTIENHTTCQHCFRQYATPFQLQCHIENVHSPYETTTKCKICELAFETEQLFLQHMKDTHKPGEMPYVCQVTIRTSMGQARAAGGPVQEVPTRKVYPPVMPPKPQEPPACSTVHTIPSVAKAVPKAEKRKAVERISPLLIDMQDIRKLYGNQVCLECNIDITNVSNVSNHFPTYVHCSRCRYSTSCSRAYADHMISYHTQRGKPKYLMFGKVKKSAILLVCTSCTFAVETGDGDEMAQHLDQNPGHGPCCFVTFSVGDRKGKAAKVMEEPQPASQSKLPVSDSEVEEVGSSSVQNPPADEEQKDESLGKSQQVKTVRLSTVCSSNYINAKISTRPALASSPTHPAAASDGTELGAGEGHAAPPEPESPISVEEERSSPPPVCLAEDRAIFSPEGAVEEESRPGPIGDTEDKNAVGSPAPLKEGDNDVSNPASDEENKSVSSPPPCAAPEREAASSPEPLEEEGGLSKAGTEGESQPQESPPRRKSLSEQEVKVVLHALCCGMRAATERYGESRSQVEQWLNQCAQQLDLLSVDGEAGASTLLSLEAEERLVEWVLLQRERQLPLTEETFLLRLSELLGSPGPGSDPDPDPSSSRCLWGVGFLLRHNLIAYAKITVARQLPWGMEGDARSFLEFAQPLIAGREFPRRMIGNVDEIPIFLEPEVLSRPEGSPGALGVTGSGQPQFVVVFTLLADGGLLPTMVFSRGGLPPWLTVPSGVLLEVKETGHGESEVLELWLSRVWQSHAAQARRGRSALVLDADRGHLSDGFIDRLSRCCSLPLVVPAGCTSRLQPLDMCVSQAFRNFLQKRWAEYAREARCYRDVYGDVLQSLLNWVAEVAEFVAANGDLVRQSFAAAGLLPGPTSAQHRAAVQEELVSFLQEQLELGARPDDSTGGGGDQAPGTLPSDPRLLTRLFEAESDAESFHGFPENDL